MAEVYQTAPQNITQNIRAICDAEELAPDAACRDYLRVPGQGERRVRRPLKRCSLDMAVSVRRAAAALALTNPRNAGRLAACRGLRGL